MWGILQVSGTKYPGGIKEVENRRYNTVRNFTIEIGQPALEQSHQGGYSVLLM
jgi:hypothetical protein